MSRLQILLIQARVTGDPMAEHERQAFAMGCKLAPEQFRIFNVAVDEFDDFELGSCDAVMIGGSGDYSLVEGGFPWHGDFLNLVRHLVSVEIPTFGSCFGFQAIVQALNGDLVADADRSEVGTFAISRTEVADSHPLFAGLPETFDAQLGHKDSAIRLPEGVSHLARSERCEYQAIAVDDTPIVATQFHPELTREGSLERFENYLQGYKKPGQDIEEAMAYARKMHRPSPDSCGLLCSFIERVRESRRRGLRVAVGAE